MHKNNKPNSPYLIKSQSAQYYECSYCCDSALVLVCGCEKFFITDGRYEFEAKQSVDTQTEVICSRDLLATLCSLIEQHKIASLIFDPLELCVWEFEKIESLSSVRLERRVNFHQELRKIKSLEEIEKIRISQEFNQKAFRAFGKFLQGCQAKNEQELQFLSKNFLSYEGEFSLSFEPIFALNGNGAKPHALPSKESILKRGDWVLFDAGIKYEQYCSDMTRCAVFGDDLDFFAPQELDNPKFQEIYSLVAGAKEYAITHIKEGMKAKEIDALARDFIAKRGYGDFFMHSLGHGIGLDIHELPRISPKSEEIITEGMVFSIEPGVYLPSEFGVRLEDLVVIKDGRAEIL